MVGGRSISGSYLFKLLQAGARSGVDPKEVLLAVGLDERFLNKPDARIEKRQFIDAMLRVMSLTEDEFVGFGAGRKSKPGTFSMMAHAVINCSNLERAVRRSLQFYDLFELGAVSRLYVGEELAIFSFDLPKKAEFRDYIQEALVFLSLRFMSWLVGKAVVPDVVLFDFESDDADEEYRSLFPCRVEYGASVTEIRFTKKYLELPLVQNELSLSRFLKDSLSQLIDGNIHNVGLPAQIRAIISREFGNNFPDFSVICGKLNMTPQTLRRRLKDANTSYQEIKDSIRKDASVYYLSKHDLSIDEIALLMGFSEASSFHRAFKKWTSLTPSQYRKEHFGEQY